MYLGGFILFSDGLSLLRWTACTKFLSVLLSAVTASRDRKIPSFLFLWALWDLRKNLINLLTMTSWYMRLYIGLEDKEQSDNPKHPAWRSSSCFWQVPGEWHRNHVKQHCIQGGVKAVLWEMLCPVCNHCDKTTSQRGQKSLGPWVMHTSGEKRTGRSFGSSLMG